MKEFVQITGTLLILLGLVIINHKSIFYLYVKIFGFHHTKITGTNLKQFNYIKEHQLVSYIRNLKLTDNIIDKTIQRWGNTFSIDLYKKIGEYDIFIGRGWSYHIKAGDVIIFEGTKYLVLSSIHTTQYSITQIYKTLLIKHDEVLHIKNNVPNKVIKTWNKNLSHTNKL